jgi:hypothetical protein
VFKVNCPNSKPAFSFSAFFFINFLCFTQAKLSTHSADLVEPFTFSLMLAYTAQDGAVIELLKQLIVKIFDTEMKIDQVRAQLISLLILAKYFKRVLNNWSFISFSVLLDS